MATSEKRYSFSEAATEQTSRELFSFSPYSTRPTQATQPGYIDYLDNPALRSIVGMSPQGGGSSWGPQELKFDVNPDTQQSIVAPNYNTHQSTVAADPDAKGFDAIQFGTEVVQGTARDYLSLGTAIVKNDADAQFDPKYEWQKKLTGRDKPFSFRDQAKEFGEPFGLSENVSLPVLAGLTALDFVTIPGKRRVVTRGIIAAHDAATAEKVLKNAGIPEEVISGLNMADRSTRITTEAQAEELLIEAVQSVQKGGPTVLDAAKSQGIFHAVPNAGKTARLYEGKPLFEIDVDRLVNKEIAGAEYAGKLDEARVQYYMDELERGARIEPVRIELGKDGVLYLEDGMHKVEAMRRLGIETTEAIDVTRRTADFDATRKALQDLIDSHIAKSPVPKATPAVEALPKIERRFIENFPELGSSNRLAELRSKTRGVITDEKALETARELGYTEERVLKIKDGTALNKEQKTAVAGVIEDSRLTLKKLEEQLVNASKTADKAEIQDLRNAIAQQKIRMYKMMAVERGVAAEAGRALQAHKATVTAIEKQERWLSKKLADPNVPDDVKDYIYKKIGEFDGTPGEINKLLRELHEASLLDMLVEFATAAKLWATQTHIVNFISSGMRMLLNSPVYAVSGLINKLDARVTGAARERFIADAAAELQGQVMGWRHAGHEAARALKDENYAFEARKLQDVQPRGPAIKGRPGKNELRDKMMNYFGKAVRLPFRALGVEDMLIRKPSEMGALYTAVNRRARMEGLIPGTKEWDEWVAAAIDSPVETFGVDFMKEVQNIADTNLFQESLHPTLQAFQEFRDKAPITKFVVPFFRTIVNLQKQAMEFSVFAPILPSVRRGLKAGGGARSDALAKMTLGTAVTLPLVYHSLEGKITLAAPNNPAQRDKFYAEGKQPYSVQIGNKWYPYHRFSPYSDWFVAAAAIGDAITNEDEKKKDEIMAHVFFVISQNFFDKSFATGMHDFLNAMADPERSDKWVQNFITGATVPNFIPLAARVVDPVVRETNSLKEAYISKVPYLSKTLPARTTVFGEPITRPGSAIERAISPVIPSPVAVDLVRAELDEVGYEMGFPGKTAAGYEMDAETYRIFQAASGKVIYQALFVMMQSPQYQNLSPRQRERAIDKVVRDTREAVKNQVAQEQIIMGEIKNELKNQGYSSKDAEDLAEKTYEIIKAKQAGSSPQEGQ